jgi:hypothetical protein
MRCLYAASAPAGACCVQDVTLPCVFVECCRYMHVPGVSARFGTDPPIWNWMMWLMARLVPRGMLQDRQQVCARVSSVCVGGGPEKGRGRHCSAQPRARQQCSECVRSMVLDGSGHWRQWSLEARVRLLRRCWKWMVVLLTMYYTSAVPGWYAIAQRWQCDVQGRTSCAALRFAQLPRPCWWQVAGLAALSDPIVRVVDKIVGEAVVGGCCMVMAWGASEAAPVPVGGDPLYLWEETRCICGRRIAVPAGGESLTCGRRIAVPAGGELLLRWPGPRHLGEAIGLWVHQATLAGTLRTLTRTCEASPRASTPRWLSVPAWSCRPARPPPTGASVLPVPRPGHACGGGF